jgi:hypothetical protein
VVKGGSLTSHTFENYKPHCSFNVDGSVNQETLDAVNEMVNVEAFASSEQMEERGCDVADGAAKVNELERICHQEQAIEEAEIWKVQEKSSVGLSYWM